MTDKRLGALLGLAVGDALGTTLEFSRPGPKPFAPPVTGPHREIIGGGPFGVAAGQVTDDTQMATCLFSSIVSVGQFDVADVARRYVGWMRHAFDIGTQTSAALRRVASGEDPVAAGRAVWIESAGRAAGNGSLMRTAPIAVLLPDAAARRAASLTDSAITHFDPRCRIACATSNAAVAALLRSASANEAIAVATTEVDAAIEDLLSEPVGTDDLTLMKARDAVLEDLAYAESDDPDLYGSVSLLEHAGFVRVAFRLAFWELMHARTFESGLVDVVNRGGDADTNGAITGALLGAAFGLDGIPEAWRHAVLTALQNRAASPLRDAYHPKAFLALG